MNIVPPLINGKSYDFQDITLNIMGAPIFGFTKINYGETQKMEMNYGAGNRPVSMSKGNIEATASITLYMEEVERLMAVAPLGNLMSIPPFDIIVAYLDASLIPRKHKIRNCSFKNNVRDTTQNDMAIPVELELMTSHIEWQ